MIARTLDNKRLSYDGRVYIEIPENIPSEDAVVIHKKRLPHLRAMQPNMLADYGREALWCEELVRMTAECRGGWFYPIQVPTEKACQRLVELGLWEEHPEDFNEYRPIMNQNKEGPQNG